LVHGVHVADVVPAGELGDVAVQVLAAGPVERAVIGPLQHRPGRLDSVGGREYALTSGAIDARCSEVPPEPETSVSKVSFRIAFEPDDVKPWPARDTEAPEGMVVDDPRKAAEVAVEMANRPGESGGSVIVAVRRLNAPIYPALVEPGDSSAGVEREIREKSTR